MALMLSLSTHCALLCDLLVETKIYNFLFRSNSLKCRKQNPPSHYYFFPTKIENNQALQHNFGAIFDQALNTEYRWNGVRKANISWNWSQHICHAFVILNFVFVLLFVVVAVVFVLFTKGRTCEFTLYLLITNVTRNEYSFSTGSCTKLPGQFNFATHF